MDATEWRRRIVRQACDSEGTWQETILRSGWTVREEYGVENGRRVVAKLTISQTGDVVPSGGISARLLRTVRVGQFSSALRQALKTHFGIPTADGVFESMGWFARPRRRLRPRYARADDLYYAELARDYVQLLFLEHRNPIATLAKQRGAPLVRVRSHIHLARANGFLSDTSRGKAAGKLTAKASEILESRRTTLSEGQTVGGAPTPRPSSQV